jgi:DNA-binding NarL/FixJ family response regulator
MEANHEELGSIHEMKSGALALVVAPPGRLSDGWQALLLATPQIAAVRRADCAPSAIGVAEDLAPDLVLLDTELCGEGIWDILNQIKVKCPHCRCIALVCNARRRREALVAGADDVLIKGSPGVQLPDAVEALLEQGPEDA